MYNKLNIGIVGCGVIGNAMRIWLSENTKHVIRVADPKLDMDDCLMGCDIVFINIHIPTEDDGTQDLTNITQIITNQCPNVPIFIRSTMALGNTEVLRCDTGMDINFMPEFLTERSAVSDFIDNDMVYTNHVPLLQSVFVGKPFITMSSTEAELSKYIHNVFGALKVTYFNGVHSLCDSMELDYNSVLAGVMVSGYIDSNHTIVPHGGSYGYGGKCLPKDVNSLISTTDGHDINKLISILPELNDIFKARG